MSEPFSAHPVGGVDYPRTFQELLEWFPDNAACLAYLERLRWPEGFTCPACGQPGGWRTAKARWMCRACGRQSSVTAGTIFHQIRTPLSTWFAAIWFITSQKNGMSAQSLQRVLGFGSYETAWAWLQKLRRAMVRPERELLSGVVELDEVFIGNESRGRVGGVKDHTAAMVAVESVPGRKLGRVRIEVPPPPWPGFSIRSRRSASPAFATRGCACLPTTLRLGHARAGRRSFRRLTSSGCASRFEPVRTDGRVRHCRRSSGSQWLVQLAGGAGGPDTQ